jgi:hypothetical protein
MVYVAANRDISTGDYKASVVTVDNVHQLSTINIYRGQIKTISPMENFTFKDFSVLDEMYWDYNNLEKTFKIDLDTRLITDSGPVSVREFAYYGEANYIGDNIYVVGTQTEAKLISTTSYGAFNVRGKVYSVNEAGNSDDSSTTSTSTEGDGTLTLVNSAVYDLDTNKWIVTAKINLNVLKSAIIIKNGELINFNDINEGDLVRILKKDKTASGDAYIVMIEK